MKTLITFLAALLGMGSLAFAQATTMPADLAPTKVLIVPFTGIGNVTGHEWVGAAIQENLMTEANGNVEVQPVALDRPLPRGDAAQLTAAARGAGAALVVSGAFQWADAQLRVTGEVTDVNSGRVLTTLKATGALIDLFKIEDTLGSQLQSVLPQPPASAPVVADGADQSGAAAYAQAPVAGPQTTYVYQTPVYTYPPNYVYTYPDYGYPYYYGGYPVFIGGGFGRPFFHPFVPFRSGFRPGFSGGFRGGFRGGISGAHGR